MQDQKNRQKSPSGQHRTILLAYIFATKADIDNRKKVVKQQRLPHMSSQYGELRITSGWDLLVSLRHPCKFQLVSRLDSVTARHSGSGRQPNFAALNRGRHLYSAEWTSRWALAHISSYDCCPIISFSYYSCIGLYYGTQIFSYRATLPVMRSLLLAFMPHY